MTDFCEVLIVGGGIAGLSLAHFVAHHRSVMILEAEEALGYHSTGRSAAEFTRRFHTDLVGRLAAWSQAFLEEPPHGFSDVKLLHQRGNLIVASEEKKHRAVEAYAAEVSSQSGPGLEWLSVAEACSRAPILNEKWVKAAFFDPQCWDVEVDSLLQGYARSAKKHEAVTRNRTKLMSAVREKDYWLVETTSGSIKANILVNAAGAWADEVALKCGVTPVGLTPLRRTAITIDLPEGTNLQTLPEITEVDEDFYMKPESGRLMVSPADETLSVPCDAQPEEIDIAYAAWYTEEATNIRISRITHKWAGLRTFAADRAPVVGFSNKSEGFFWLAGQGGFGIQTSPAIGEIAAALICDPTCIQPRLSKFGLSLAAMDPNRF